LVPATVTRAYIRRLVCQEPIEVPHQVEIDSTSRYHPPPRLGEAVGLRDGRAGEITDYQFSEGASRSETKIDDWKLPVGSRFALVTMP